MMTWLRGAGLSLARQFAKFGVVGAVAYVVDVTVFNVLLYAGADPLLGGLPLAAKISSSAVATVVSWLGNRYWTFRQTRRTHAPREFLIFVVMCCIGLGISLSVLWFSHYVLGFTSPLADNIAANVVGLAAGTLFRFWAYRRFVFTNVASPAQPDPAHQDIPDPAHQRPSGLRPDAGPEQVLAGHRVATAEDTTPPSS